MNIIGTIHHEHVCKTDRSYFRSAVRAIIIEGPFIYLIQSKYGEYKFPGGGVERGEDLFSALKREVLEEAGIIISEEITEYGEVIEIREAKDNTYDSLVMRNFYYIVKPVHYDLERNLDDYEKEYGYVLKKVSLEEAIQNNASLENNNLIPWNKRELYVLKHIKENLGEEKC